MAKRLLRVVSEGVKCGLATVPAVAKNAIDATEPVLGIRERVENSESRQLRRVLGYYGVIPRRCRDCANFDHTAGQIELDKNPAFPKQWLSPAQMAASQRGALDEHRNPVDEPLPRTERWEDYGACLKYVELVDGWRWQDPHKQAEGREVPCEGWR